MRYLQDEDMMIAVMNSTMNSTNITTSMTNATIPTDSNDGESSGGGLAATILSNLFLFFLIFGLSATVKISSIRAQLQNKFAILTGVCMQFLIMPLLGYLSVISLPLTRAMGLTLLVVTTSPGGSYSNWWCSLFNADLALSIAMTTISTLLSVALLPANLILYSTLAYGRGGGGDSSVVAALDFGSLFISLGIVIGAIFLGLYASWRFERYPSFSAWANRGGSISGLALIVVSVFLSSGKGGSNEDGEKEMTQFWSHPWQFYVAVAVPCFLGIALANFLSRLVRLKKPETVAIAIECCYQNTGIATSVAVTMFSDPVDRAQAVAIPLFYGVLEAVVIGIYCIIAWKAGWTKAPKDERICTVIAKSYETDTSTSRDEDDEEDGLPRIAEEEHEEMAIGAANADELKRTRWRFWKATQSLSTDSSLGSISTRRGEDTIPWWQIWKRRAPSPRRQSQTLTTPRKDKDESKNKAQKRPMRSRLTSEDSTIVMTENRNRTTSEDNTIVEQNRWASPPPSPAPPKTPGRIGPPLTSPVPASSQSPLLVPRVQTQGFSSPVRLLSLVKSSQIMQEDSASFEDERVNINSKPAARTLEGQMPAPSASTEEQTADSDPFVLRRHDDDDDDRFGIIGPTFSDATQSI